MMTDTSFQAARSVVHLSGSAALEMFPLVPALHREVMFRHKNDESQNIEEPDETDELADRLRVTATATRTAEIGA